VRGVISRSRGINVGGVEEFREFIREGVGGCLALSMIVRKGIAEAMEGEGSHEDGEGVQAFASRIIFYISIS